MIRRPSRLSTALVAAAALLLSGCEFEGAYDLPLPGSPVDEDNSYTVTAAFADVLNVVPRSVVMVNDVTVGEVIEVDRVGWHAEIIDARGRRHRAAGQRHRRDPAVQPPRREVRRPRGAHDRGPGRGARGRG